MPKKVSRLQETIEEAIERLFYLPGYVPADPFKYIVHALRHEERAEGQICRVVVDVADVEGFHEGDFLCRVFISRCKMPCTARNFRYFFG